MIVIKRNTFVEFNMLKSLKSKNKNVNTSWNNEVR